jgi:predicted nucleic acid-binding protein
MVEPVEIPSDVCRDLKDLPMLGTAVAGNAELLVTVDKDLLALGTYQNVTIIKPGAFWRRSAGYQTSRS